MSSLDAGLHPLTLLLDKGETATETEALLVTAIFALSVQPQFVQMKPEAVYDEMVKRRERLRPIRDPLAKPPID